MIDERMEELAALHALGLLKGEEEAFFENELRKNPELQRLVAELQRASAALAVSAPERSPSPQLRRRLLEKIGAPAPSRVILFPQWIPWAAAACLAIFCGLLIQDRHELQQKIVALNERDSMSQVKIAMLTSKMENAPNAMAVACWNKEQGRGTLTVEKLPMPGSEQDYQLWVIDPATGKPVSAGVFSVDASGNARISFHPQHPMDRVDKFAVSIERKGGAPQPEGQIILVSN